MRRELLLIAEVIDAAERIVELTAGAVPADLDDDRTRRESMLWSFTVLGEAVRQLPDEVRAAYPAVAWSAAIAMRNRLVHAYWQMSTTILVTTAQDDIPDLLEAVRRIQEAMSESPQT